MYGTDYEGGKIVGHDGQWYAGKKGAKPDLFMPTAPKVGQKTETKFYCRGVGLVREQGPGVQIDLTRYR